MRSGRTPFTATTFSTGNFLTMKLLAGLVSSMPRKGSRPNSQKEDKEDPSTIIRCMAENWQQGEEQIQACRDCFKAVEETDAGLTQAKACVAQFLQMEDKACSAQLSALKSFKDEEKGMAVLKCFDEKLEKENNDRCIKESQSTDITEKLTDSSLCVLESWKYGMAYVKNATRAQGGRGKGKRPRAGKGGKKLKMMKLITKAHCSLATNEDGSKTTECLNCFKAAVKIGKQGKGKSGRGKKEMSPEMFSAMTTCSEQHLNPTYSKCTAMMKDTAADKKETHKCYMRVLISNLVGKCSTGVGEATPATLSSVMECGKMATIGWVKKNASPEVAEEIGNFLEEEEDEDEDIEG